MTSRKICSAICLVLFAFSWTPAATHRDQTTGDPEKVRREAIYAPKPDYPWEAMVNHQTGACLAVLTIDRSSGDVTNVEFEQRTGVPSLDKAVLLALRRWRFKPGSLSQAKIPVTFTMTRGGQVTYELRVKKSRPMDDVLAGFLGKGTIIDGPIPRYPMSAARGEKQGKGLYELHVGGDGKVAKVTILRGSGDATFDRVTVETLRKWRLRTGPKVIELPLAFKLTPTTYDVGIP